MCNADCVCKLNFALLCKSCRNNVLCNPTRCVCGTSVNLWPNRLIGDGKLPPGERMTRSNISKYDAPDAEKYMRVSGLLGPVRVKFFERVKITPQDKN